MFFLTQYGVRWLICMCALFPLLFLILEQLCTTMPSDLAKKKAAKKKEAAKARQRTKKPDEVNGESEQPEQETQRNGAESNGERRTDL